jgi:Dna[CI] antecedent, DciA
VSSHSPRSKPAALGSLLATSREAAARYAGTAIDREQWRRIVGERIALRTEPGAKRGRELTVHVASASWAQELALLVNEIVVRLKAAGIAVDTVRFRVKEIAAQTRDPAARKPVYRKAALPGALLSQLNAIEDPELRDAIGEAAALWLALGETPSKPLVTKTPSSKPARGSTAPPATSEPPSVRNPRDAESRNARSVRTPSPEHARQKGKP